MATAKQTRSRIASRWWLKLLVVLFFVGAGVYWYYSAQILGLTNAGTAYGAHNACSCRYLGGRDLKSCQGDFIPGMEAVFLSEDEEAKSVTAWVPLAKSNTATYREGFGCVLEPWKG